MAPRSRPKVLELLGAAAGTAARPDAPARGQAFSLPPARPYTPPKRPATRVTLGHGGRGRLNAGLAERTGL